MSRSRPGRRHRERRGRWQPRGEPLEARLPLDASGDFPLDSPDPGPDPDFSFDFGPGLGSDFDFGTDPGSETFPPIDFGGTDFGGTDFGGTDFGGTDFGGTDFDGTVFGEFGGGMGQAEPLNIQGTDPADGASIDQHPTSVTVYFDRPLDAFSLGFDDVYLEKLDGETVTRIGADSGAYEELDAGGNGLVLRLSAPLGSGRYRVVLSGFAFLMGANGELLDNAGQDQTLAEFEIADRGVTRDQAVDLGMPGSKIREISGSLDLAAHSTAVALYRFTIPPGRSWRFGAEVAAERIGSPLNAVLTLFDAAGRPIAVASTGRPDALSDPYLFAGLEPGTYYLGVSQEVNRPDVPGGYDLALGLAGLPADPSAGGRFTLRLVADPITGPTKVIDSGLDFADPQSKVPTGFHLQFSGPMLVGNTGEALFEAATDGVEVVDQFGRVWPVAAVGYDETRALLSYVFRTPLPAGKYTVRLASAGGLDDLAGRTPVTPGLPTGVLARFNVEKAVRRGGPNDLGVLFPDALDAGVEREVDLRPGESLDLSFFNLFDGLYNIQIESSSGSVRAERAGAGTRGFVPFSFQGNAGLQQLSAGLQRVRLTAFGDSPVRVRFVLSVADHDWERLLQNGLGQGYALEMRLNAPGPATETEPSAGGPSGGSPTPSSPQTPPTSPTPSPAPTEAPGSVPTLPVDAATDTDGGGSPAETPAADAATLAASGTSVPRGPAGLLLAFGGQPVGRPSTTAESLGGTPAEPGRPDGAVPLNFEPGYAQGGDEFSAFGEILPGGGAAPNPDLPDEPGGDGADAGEPKPEDEAEPRSTDGQIAADKPVGSIVDVAAIVAVPGFYESLRENLSRLLAFRPVVADAAPVTTAAEGFPGETSEAGQDGAAEPGSEETRSKLAFLGSSILVASTAILIDQSRRYLRRRRQRLHTAGPGRLSHGPSWPSGPRALRFGSAPRRSARTRAQD